MNLALVPLRGGSKSIPKKNIKEIAGKSLCAWVLEAACEAKVFDKVVVSTDSEEIAGVVSTLGLDVEILQRPEHLATDEASTEEVMLHAMEHYECDTLTTIQATSPLVTAEDFVKAFEKFNSDDLDSLLTATKVKRFFWNPDGTPINYEPANRPRRQDFQGVYMENGSFYIAKRKILEKFKCRLGGKIGIYEMAPETATEIDDPEDWAVVESLLKKRNEKEILEKLKKVKLLAFDCDGVLTDGGMYYSESGDELKKFNTRDGQGLELIREKGIITAMITGENSEAARRRAEKLKIDEVYIGIKDKAKPMQELLKKYDLSTEQVAYIGDDNGDIPAFNFAGITIAVNDAIIKEKALFVLASDGGKGAVREVCEAIFSAIKLR